jgi:hypothetical protein
MNEEIESSFSRALGGKGKTDKGESKLASALESVAKFLRVKRGSASTTSRYRNAMQEAGLGDDETGIEH